MSISTNESFAHSGHIFNAFTESPPIIDGEISSGEWDAADSFEYNITLHDQYGGIMNDLPLHIKSSVMNDNENLYFLTKVTASDDVDWRASQSEYRFDGNHNLQYNDDYRLIFDSLGFRDMFEDESPKMDVDSGGTTDGEAATRNWGKMYVLELSHPLCSGDSYDFCLHSGDITGFSFGYSLWAGQKFWPSARNTQYADIEIAEQVLPDLVVGSITYTPSNPDTDDLIEFTVTVKNVGDSSAIASMLGIRVEGETLEEYQIPPLPEGEFYEVTRKKILSIPQDYRVTATADINKAVLESNEGNNDKGNTVSLEDRIPPTIKVPPSMEKHPESENGVRIIFDVSAYDNVDGIIKEVNCVPASGNLFPIGPTEVTCVALDESGNKGEGQFIVTVLAFKPEIGWTQLGVIIAGVGTAASIIFGIWKRKKTDSEEKSKTTPKKQPKTILDNDILESNELEEKHTQKILSALSVKLKKIFETDEKFLTFPKGLGFSHSSLDFMKSSSTSKLDFQQSLNYKGQFARLLNIIPEDSNVWSPDSSHFLWDRLITTLQNAIFAESTLTPEEDKQLDEAIDFLQDTKIQDGEITPVYSPALVKYYELKEVWQDAERAYLDEKITVECSTGPESEKLKREWSKYRERHLFEIKHKAEQDWKNLGHKEKVEHYQTLRNRLEPKKYSSKYRDAYLNELKTAEISDLNGIGFGFYTTFFSPIDAFDTNSSWNTLTMTKQEIELLYKSENRTSENFYSKQGNDLEAISMDYKNIVIMRPWFKQEFFESRYWKLKDNSIISDGNMPRKGTIPAYITSMIVVKNVKITRKKTSTAFSLNSLLNRSYWQKTFSAISSDKLIPNIKPTQINIDKKIDTLSGKTSFVHSEKESIDVVNADAKSVKNLEIEKKKHYVDAKYDRTTIKTPHVSQKVPESFDVLISNRDLTTETYNFDNFMVLAYVCKRMPKSPNPDNTLTWNE